MRDGDGRCQGGVEKREVGEGHARESKYEFDRVKERLSLRMRGSAIRVPAVCRPGWPSLQGGGMRKNKGCVARRRELECENI